ncbi:patatin-like phospholipase family protein [Motilimonas eburnea]|uniref:patatin-like phospholipase family protein n=1 Tax=Motilimonas eburnea TaxID=1737488 RepID=UPI001E549F4D|nr:patatin-like phospholipase family protein [Motilimonas eburnea]MCE2573458.1 patatin-like phospholipase family protein [Motilimonas eburnea]
MKAYIPLLVAVLTTGCSAPYRDAVEPEQISQFTPLEQTNLRYWGDATEYQFSQSAMDKFIAQQSRSGLLYDDQGEFLPAYHLALSGGGESGAFGAGVLSAWSENGDRPTFTTVTGVSTGAIISVFAFLGSDYDDMLTGFYTGVTDNDLYEKKFALTALFSTSLVDTKRYQNIVRNTLNADLVAEVAKEYNKGRLLLVGTTHLDAQRPMIWNMGEIAKQGTPESVKLFQDIILASSSIPGVFPPQLIDVTDGIETKQELHVDGGVTNQVFLFPSNFNEVRGDHKANEREHHVYVIRNTEMLPKWHNIELNIENIALRSLATVLKFQGKGDVHKIYQYSQHHNMDFKLAFIDEDFTLDEPKTPFDQEFMRTLYDYGYNKTRQQQVWQASPPDAFN